MTARNLAKLALALRAHGKEIEAAHVWRLAMELLINERKGQFIMKKWAWVTGSKSTGYTLVLDHHADLAGDFRGLHGVSFLRYRAAQDIANAINALIKAKGDDA